MGWGIRFMPSKGRAHSLISRIFLAMMLLVAVTVGILSVADQYFTSRLFNRFQATSLNAREQQVVRLLEVYYRQHHDSFQGVAPVLSQMGPLGPGPFYVITLNHHVIASSPPGGGLRPLPHASRIPLISQGKTVAFVIWNQPPQPQPPATTPALIFLRTFRQWLWLAGVAALSIAFLLSWIIAKSIGRPLKLLTEGARQLASGTSEARVEVSGGSEIHDLADAFNGLAAHLATQQRLREALVEDVAHELRHPLTHIQGNLEAMLDGMLPIDPDHIEVVYRETRRLNQIVEDLRLLEASRAGELGMVIEPTPLLPLVEHTMALLKAQLEAKDISAVVLDLKALPAVQVDYGRTLQILGNVVSNALAYTPPGGQITIAGRVSWVEGAKCVCLDVADDGPGIGAEHLPFVFQRFYRADKARRADGGSNKNPESQQRWDRERDPSGSHGTGLGLSIVKSLMQQQGGRVWIDSQEGAGTTLHLAFQMAATGATDGA